MIPLIMKCPQCPQWFGRFIIVAGLIVACLYAVLPDILKDRLVTNTSPPSDSPAHEANRIYAAHFHSEAIFIAVMTSSEVAVTCASVSDASMFTEAGCGDYALCRQVGTECDGVRILAIRQRAGSVRHLESVETVYKRCDERDQRGRVQRLVSEKLSARVRTTSAKVFQAKPGHGGLYHWADEYHVSETRHGAVVQ